MKVIIQIAKESLTHRRDVLNRSIDVLTNAEHLERRAIEHALEQISHGNYGLCEQCGGAIGNQRLKALPEATRCANCSITSSRAIAP